MGGIMPLIIKVPGMTKPGMHCKAVVNLLDLYPTLTELCGLPGNPANEGRSIVPLLHNVDKKWDHPTLTTMGRNRHSIRSEKWRYIRYQDGSEELYDHSLDPMEWKNLAGDPKYNKIKKELSASFPEVNAEEVPFRVGGKE
jgi:arylsulfatase A-like enzyme